MRADFTDKISTLAQALEQLQVRNEQHTDTVRETLERRLEEAESRQVRRLDDATAGLEGLVQEAAKPMLAGVRDEQEATLRRVESLDTNLRKFDEQAARMVTYFNDVSQRVEQRQDELADTLKTDVATQIESLKRLVEENDSSVRRFQTEVGQSVTSKLNDAEDRFNNRLLAAESRMKEDAGQKIAEIDAHVGRVSSGLDDTMTVLNDRIAGMDDRFVEFGRRVDGVEASVEGIDQQALDELKEKMSTAAGEAMLVRIEMERLEKNVNERSDGLTVRLTEVETQLQDATMDVSTSVQLDRLEEIERAMIELPNLFVQRTGGFDPPSGPPGIESAPGTQETVKNGDGAADDTSGFDASAILAAEEHRHGEDHS